jgi:hypothetical protein
VTFIVSFFDWYSYSETGCGRFCESLSDNGWSGFLTLLAILLVLVGTAMVALELFMPHVKLPVPNRLIGLGAYALASLLTIIAIFVVPGLSIGGVDVPDADVNKGHSFGFWLGLILILAGTVVSFMRFQQTGGQLPIGGRTAGGPSGPPPSGGGYGPPPGSPPPPPSR